MTEFIGSRISLVSRSDIRYVGTLIEINSAESTVALEHVTSFGTEGRKGNPEDELAPSESTYEYIVFRGSDVKDLRVEEAPAAKENIPPQVPNDPAILGTGTRPRPQSQQGQPPQQHRQAGPQGPQQGPGQPQGPTPPYAQHGQYPPPFYPPPGGFGRSGPGGFPPMPYGAPPPGWYGPPGQGFPPGPYPPYGFPHQYGQFPPPQHQQQPGAQGPKPAPIGPGANKQSTPSAGQTPSAPANEKPVEPKAVAKPDAPTTNATKPPSPPNATKPTQSEVQAAIAQPPTAQPSASTASKTATPSGPKNNRIVTPAVPLKTPTIAKVPLQSRPFNAGIAAGIASAPKPAGPDSTLRDATQAATAAVAAAMAKLPGAAQPNGSGMDHLSRKVNEMRINDAARAPRNPAGAGFAPRGGRGPRGARGGAQGHKIEVPTTDFDFASANAKFNKDDLVKEAGSSTEETTSVISPSEGAPTAKYDKRKSFFDDISSEAKERAEGTGNRPGGREWRGEEQKKNVDTFGQGSVDNGYRGGFRGRGRGRGRGAFRGRGTFESNGHTGRGGYRGRRDDQTFA